MLKRNLFTKEDLKREVRTLGLSKEFSVLNCKDLKQKVLSAESGVCCIDPDGGSHGNAFQALCDQQTDRGGSTLVWSYTFTDYSNFNRGSNAVTPRPSWSASAANVRVSTTVPLSETHYETINFALWSGMGKEFLIKSNIKNWIARSEGTGSIVQQKGGSVTCKIVKQVSGKCLGAMPNFLRPYENGMILDDGRGGKISYFFDGSTILDVEYPVHDPCGKSQANQSKGVANPHGNIFVR
ncbi:hypothetical protein AWC38_SpisGene22699 [Stylophora pistillata]|uniref:Uncharacterized protein n=1 Tax=Stylophora pistillata TaxID=50429 RepID=A0A2B4R8U5_STYPI|nr:hypothetical protein AWC38_SpisGene22699 [Stylophora pistillata]